MSYTCVLKSVLHNDTAASVNHKKNLCTHRILYFFVKDHILYNKENCSAYKLVTKKAQLKFIKAGVNELEDPVLVPTHTRQLPT